MDLICSQRAPWRQSPQLNVDRVTLGKPYLLADERAALLKAHQQSAARLH